MYILGMDDSWKKDFKDKADQQRRTIPIVKTTNIGPYEKEYQFFVLAPLYVHAGVKYSIPDCFEHEFGEKQRILVDYRREITSGLGKWSTLVEGIATEQWDEFCRYVLSLLFVSFKKKLVWIVRYHDINLESTNAEIVDTHALPIRVRLFLPDGNKHRMLARGGCPATLSWENPNSKVVGMANKILEKDGSI